MHCVQNAITARGITSAYLAFRSRRASNSMKPSFTVNAPGIFTLLGEKHVLPVKFILPPTINGA